MGDTETSSIKIGFAQETSGDTLKSGSYAILLLIVNEPMPYTIIQPCTRYGLFVDLEVQEIR